MAMYRFLIRSPSVEKLETSAQQPVPIKKQAYSRTCWFAKQCPSNCN